MPIPSGLVRPRSPPPIPQPEWPVGVWAEEVEGVGLGNHVHSGLGPRVQALTHRVTKLSELPSGTSVARLKLSAPVDRVWLFLGQ